MRILITGAGGMLGRDVCSAVLGAGHEVLPFLHEELDVSVGDAVRETFERVRPDAVVNCAAWTDVDGAESRVEEAFAVNGSGAGNVAVGADAVGAWTVHVSTDYVFDGRQTVPYVESDPVGPLSAYGRSKLSGERAVAAAAPDAHTIVRTSWLFGAGGPCFPKTILRLAGERDELTVVDDQVGCPTFTEHVAPALVELACGLRVGGVVHVAAGGECSWYELALELVARAGLVCSVLPGRTAELGRPAPRPGYSVLRSARVGAPTLPHWRQGIVEFIASGVPLR
jgi:dTDP-4-dehydrorhamnose reductase